MPSAIGSVAIDSGTVLVLISLVAIPFAAFSFSRSGEAYRSIGKGGLSIDQDLPAPRYAAGAEAPLNPAVRAAEVRQMVEAKASRLERRGEAPIDVDVETERLLREPAETAGAGDGQRPALEAEVRQLVLARNERLLRQGRQPLDVEAETKRQLADFVGSD